MLIALTGIPGVGKTQCAEILRKRGRYVIDLNELATSKGFGEEYDEEYDSHIIDVEALDGFITSEYRGAEVIFDGHLSHLLTVDMAVILRCNPIELQKRLQVKSWSDQKLLENVQAEVLDVIKIEAYEHLDRVYELDTTAKRPEEIADLFEAIISGRSKGDNVAWLEDFEYLLFQ